VRNVRWMSRSERQITDADFTSFSVSSDRGTHFAIPSPGALNRFREKLESCVSKFCLFNVSQVLREAKYLPLNDARATRSSSDGFPMRTIPSEAISAS